MIEAFVYPVSAVLKFWHWLLADVAGVASSPSWVVSIVLLVVTVRSLIAPLQWTSIKTGRRAVLMRPHLAAIERKYAGEVSAEAVREMEAAKKQVHKDHEYNPFAGCLPALVQLPFFLGLYRLLLWMAVPQSSIGHSLGILSPEEVESFRSATLAGVPLPAYMSMSEEQFAHLGTTLGDVRSLAIPLLITAVFFTSGNMVLTQIRSRSTLEWENPLSLRVYRFMWVIVPLAGAGIALAGLTGLVPVALLLYWVTGNLSTLVQSIVLWIMVVRVFPLTAEHRNHIAEQKAKQQDAAGRKRQAARQRRRRQVAALARPSTLPAVRREIAEEKAAERAQRDRVKAAKKQIAAQRGAVIREDNKRQRQALKQQRGQQKEAPSGGRHSAKTPRSGRHSAR